MAHPLPPPSIFPLGDSAITIEFGNCIDEQHSIKAQALYDWLQTHPVPGVLDIIMAYCSVSVFYDPGMVAEAGHPFEPVADGGVYIFMEDLLGRAWTGANGAMVQKAREEARVFEIPVCYEGEYAPDLAWVAERRGLSPQQVIERHLALAYRVYMVGFLPGFPYLGRLDPMLQVPRKPHPVNVPAGGVGIAGLQTGIYPLNSPGGWQIIGRTPMALFDKDASPPVRLRAGDEVKFRAVEAAEFRALARRPG